MPTDPEVKDTPITMAALGAQLRSLRKTRELTLEQLAARSGVSAGLLSQMERGQGNPSFNTLVQVAHALSVPVASLFRTEASGSPVVRRAERRRIDIHAGDAAGGGPAAGGGAAAEPTVTELLTPSLAGALEVLMIEVPPGYSTEATPFTHEGEEFGLILEGRHEVHLGEDTYTLEVGDSITYSSRTPHWYRNPGDEPVRSLWVITPPTF